MPNIDWNGSATFSVGVNDLVEVDVGGGYLVKYQNGAESHTFSGTRSFGPFTQSGTVTLTSVYGPFSYALSNVGTAFQAANANDLSASTGSSLVGFVQSGTGAVATTVQGELRKLAPAPVAVSASRNIGADDQGAVLVCSQAVTLTIPAGLASGFSLAVEQSGTGQVTVAAGAGVTLRNVDSQFKTSSQFAIIGLMNVGSDTYNLSGSTSA
jgi:hypothetical protein